MKTKNAKELASIILLLLSNDYESVQLGISLFLDHYLITNYPKYKKFKVSLKYNGYKPPSKYCESYSSENKEFNKNQFIRMLSSKSTDIRKKVCAIINFIYNNVDPKNIRLKNGKIIKNYNYNDYLSHNLWGTSLDHLQINNIKPTVYKTWRLCEAPASKKKMKYLMAEDYGHSYNRSDDRSYIEYLSDIRDLLNDLEDNNVNSGISNPTPCKIIRSYKRYLQEKFKNKGKKCIKSFADLQYLLTEDLWDHTRYYISDSLYSKLK